MEDINVYGKDYEEDEKRDVEDAEEDA